MTYYYSTIPTIRLMEILLAMRKSCKVELKFHFEVELNLDQNKEFFLAVENAAEFEIFLNGNRLSAMDIGWWKDSSFKKVDIKSLVKNGVNEVILQRDFYQSPKVYEILFAENVLESEKNKLTFDVELENIYVVGDFGVVSQSGYSYGDRKALFTDGPFKIVDRPQQVRTGDLTEQGFCFFAGTGKISQEIRLTKKDDQRIIVDLGKPNAAMVKVFLNHQLVKTILWAPYTADITDFALEGVNKSSYLPLTGTFWGRIIMSGVKFTPFARPVLPNTKAGEEKMLKINGGTGIVLLSSGWNNQIAQILFEPHQSPLPSLGIF